MAQRVPELLTALTETGRFMEEIYPILDEEKRCIIGLDHQGLELQVQKKTELFELIYDANARCRKLVREMAVELELPEADTISPLLPLLAEPQREALQAVQRELLERGARLQMMHASNADLLQGALQTNTRCLQFFSRILNNSSTYGCAGQMSGKAAARPRIISKEA
jgi:flagellar biosynthesis/type III secretory pathway chaperone